MSQLKDITQFAPLSKAVKRAALDMYEDYGKVESRYMAWAVDGIKKLSRETLKSGKRFAILNVNKHLGSAVLPIDFKYEVFVGFINKCGQKIPLTLNTSITNPAEIEEIPCDNQCDKHCDCYPKQLCCDLDSEQIINKIRINDTFYDQTITTTLLESGEYYRVTTTPVQNLVDSGIDYITKKEYITAFDLEECGCIKKNWKNKAKLEHFCYDYYCCYCTGCELSNTDFGGYKIFPTTNTIVFDGDMIFDKVYIEYIGSLPKRGNEYLVPEVAFETLVNWVKFKSVENKKGVPMNERLWFWERYTTERGNMNKINGRISLSDILHSALLVPKFDKNYNHCPLDSCGINFTTPTPEDNQIYLPVNPTPEPMPPVICKPTSLTVEGSEMAGGQTYNNSSLAGLSILKIFANPINRFLQAGEFTVLTGGGFTTSLGPFGAGDFFEIFPDYCS